MSAETINPYEVVLNELGMAGAMLSGSKSAYERAHPDNLVVFNANLIVEGSGKIWYGDIDITESEDALQRVADQLGKVYVLREGDARFKYEDNPRLENAVRVFERSKG